MRLMATYARAEHAYTELTRGTWACITVSDNKDVLKSRKVASLYHLEGSNEVRIYRARRTNGTLEFPQWNQGQPVPFEGEIAELFGMLCLDDPKGVHEASGLAALLRG